MKIDRLSEEVINQIAAGEVIENPASVVKELIDNAIDASAHHIEVVIEAGGQQLIKVEDDGCGMDRSDVELSLERHATSKLSELSDLDTLQTMGFRGEALAAIAAISKLEIRTSDGITGTHLIADASRIQSITPCARNPGTTIEVRSLFFNTPARRKFQKSPQTNATQVSRIVQALALSHPQIAFRLISHGEILLDVTPSDWKARIRAVLGQKFCEGGFWLEQKKFFGWMGPPADATATRLGQHFFINRRPIFSPALARAVKEGYGTRLLEGMHPAVVLFTECAPDEFDVNVHPQKREVRFHDESKLYSQLHGAISRAFLGSSLPEQPPMELPTQLPWEAPSFSVRDTASHEQQAFILENDVRPLAMIGLFLLAEKFHEIWLVDLREAMIQQAIQDHSQQTLLVPIHLPAPKDEIEALVQRCCSAHLDAKAFGERTICIDAIPEWLEEKEVSAFFTALQEGQCVEETIRSFCSVREKRFSLEEATHIWKNGKAKEIRLDRNELERIFARK